MPTGDPPMHTCTLANNWGQASRPCPACAALCSYPVSAPVTYQPAAFGADGPWTEHPDRSLSDANIERIAKRVAELLKEKP